MSERDAAWLEELLARRNSARSFRPDPIPEAELRALFAGAQRAASWCNIQPWQTRVTAPPVTRALAEALEAEAATAESKRPEIPYPAEYPEPYRARRRACGYALYSAMGIERGDGDARRRAWLRNFRFFDAPHAAIVCQDRRLGPYAGVDIGVWLGTLLALAEARGIDTCPMASVAAYPEPLRRALEIPEEEAILFAIALGRRDDAPANTCRPERAPLEDTVRFIGFERDARPGESR